MGTNEAVVTGPRVRCMGTGGVPITGVIRAGVSISTGIDGSQA